MITNSESINNRLRSLDLVAEVLVKAIGVNTFPTDGTVKAAHAAATEGILQQIDHPGFDREYCTEAINHRLQLHIIFFAGGEDHHITFRLLLHRCRNAYWHMFGRSPFTEEKIIARLEEKIAQV